jgi:transcriptional regulator with XRE-family HTH domain
MNTKELGARIRAVRRARGLTQETVARRLGIQPQKMIRFESGAQCPKLDEALWLANVLDCDLTYLAGITSGYRVDPSVLPGLRYAEMVLADAMKTVQAQSKGA